MLIRLAARHKNHPEQNFGANYSQIPPRTDTANTYQHNVFHAKSSAPGLRDLHFFLSVVHLVYLRRFVFLCSIKLITVCTVRFLQKMLATAHNGGRHFCHISTSLMQVLNLTLFN